MKHKHTHKPIGFGIRILCAHSQIMASVFTIYTRRFVKSKRRNSLNAVCLSDKLSRFYNTARFIKVSVQFCMYRFCSSLDPCCHIFLWRSTATVMFRRSEEEEEWNGCIFSIELSSSVSSSDEQQWHLDRDHDCHSDVGSISINLDMHR